MKKIFALFIFGLLAVLPASASIHGSVCIDANFAANIYCGGITLANSVSDPRLSSDTDLQPYSASGFSYTQFPALTPVNSPTMAGWGGALTSTDVSNLYTVVGAYMTAVGAPQ